MRKTVYFQYYKFQKGHNSYKNGSKLTTRELDQMFIIRKWHTKFQLNISKHVGEKCEKLWLTDGDPDDGYLNTSRLKTKFNSLRRDIFQLSNIDLAFTGYQQLRVFGRHHYRPMMFFFFSFFFLHPLGLYLLVIHLQHFIDHQTCGKPNIGLINVNWNTIDDMQIYILLRSKQQVKWNTRRIIFMM